MCRVLLKSVRSVYAIGGRCESKQYAGELDRVLSVLFGQKVVTHFLGTTVLIGLPLQFTNILMHSFLYALVPIVIISCIYLLIW